jgi:hypothetical protein
MKTASLAVAGALVVAASTAHANPRPLAMSYTADTLPAGKLELEPAVDYTPVRAHGPNGDVVWYGASTLQLEVEYGITDSVELGLYLTTAPTLSGYMDTPVLPVGNGMKQRVRWRLTEPGGLLDLALYGEVSENEREIELETKLILQANLGAGLRAVANLWGERELYFDGRDEWVINPTLALTYELTPALHPGLEGWLRAEYPDGGARPRAFNLGPHAYVGPNFMVDWGKLWVTVGVYLRLTDFDYELQPGDAYGKVWGRIIFGISLD